MLWIAQALTPENLAYLNQLPDTPIHPEGASNVLVTHASPREPVWEYILTPSIAMENFALVRGPHLPGRAHAQAGYLPLVAACAVNAGPDEYRPATVDMLQPQAGASVALAAAPNLRLIINPGSVGQPRDNDARASYAILDLAAMTWRAERIAYPIELTQGQMQEAGLPRRLIDRLSFGW